MTRRILATTGLCLAGLLIVVLLLLAWILGTQSGSRMLWRGVSGAVDGLTAEAVDGRFVGPLTLRGLRFENKSVRLSIGSLQLNWAPGSLLSGAVILETLHADEVAFTQLKSAPPSEDTTPFELPRSLSLPVSIELRDIAVSSFEYRPAPEAEPLRVDKAMLVASFRGTDLSIDHLSAQGPLFGVRAKASARTRDNYPSTAALEWQASPRDLAPLSGELSIEGDLSSLRVEQTIDAPYNASQRVELQDLLGDLRLNARVELDNSRLQAIASTLPAMGLSGDVVAEGSLADLAYRAQLDAETEEFGALALLASGDFSDQVVTLAQLQLTRTPGGARFDLAGRADLQGSAPNVDIQGDWRGLAWPLVGEPQITSETGQFTVAGSPDDYRATLRTALDVPGQTAGELSLSGRGDSEAFELAELQLSLLDGSLQGRGNVQWSPQLRGAVDLAGEALNPAVLAPDFPGELSIALRAEGGVTDGAVTADIETLSLEGIFREQPLDVQLRGELQGAQVDLENLVVQSGQTRISAQGRVGDNMDLQWDIDSPDLGDLLPGATGSLTGQGRVAGRLALPAVRGGLQGRAIAYGDYRLERLSLELDVDLEHEAPSRLALTLEQALLGATRIDTLSVTGAGKRGDHQLTFQLDSPQGVAGLSLTGDLGDSDWQGELTDGELRYAELAPWSLVGPQAVRIAAQEQQLERGCWRNGQSRLCLQGRRADGDLDAAADLEAFALDYLRPLMPEAIALAGTLGAQARIRQAVGMPPELKVGLDTDLIELRTGKAADEPDELLLGLDPSRASVTYGDSGLLAELSMPFTGGGGIDARAQVDGGDKPLVERPLRGKLTLALADIGFLTALSSEIEQAAGTLSGDIDLSGTLAKVLPEGKIRLADGSLALAAPGLNIDEIGVLVSSSSGSALEFEGQASSGRGTLRLGGSARLDGARSVADIDVNGDRFEIVNTVDARASVSPDLQISVRETGIRIRGEVAVPRAAITPQELPESVVVASSDQVIMTEDGGDRVADAAKRELDASIRIVLGDAVSVDGFGFKGRLAGGLTVTQTPGQPTLGSGEVNILNGEYRAYGQGLVIEKGKILFAGGPIAEPGLNVRAVRRPAENIVVGVRVRGPLQNPDFRVFSEPGMTQSEQLSWLVLGRPLDGASDGESNMIAQAALALGLKGGDLLAGRLGSGLAVDSMGIETGSGEAGAASDVNQAAFVIGKYLSPDLFVSYGIGLFDSVSTVRLEYSLTENWKVSTESSTLSSGGDITYTLER